MHAYNGIEIRLFQPIGQTMERPNISMTRAVHSPTAIDANKTVRVPLPYDNLSTMFDVEGGHPHFPFQLVTMGRTHATLRVSGSEYLLGRLSYDAGLSDDKHHEARSELLLRPNAVLVLRETSHSVLNTITKRGFSISVSRSHSTRFHRANRSTRR